MTRRAAASLAVLLALAGAAPLAAQSRAAGPSREVVRRALETMTESDVRRRVALLADDSLRGRDTPSPELDQAAEYIAAEFARLGLRPAGDGGSFIQRYTIRRTALDSASFVLALGRGVAARWAAGRDLLRRDGPLLEAPYTGPAVLLVGMPADTARPFGEVDVTGAVVLQIVTMRQAQDVERLTPLLAGAARAGVRAWVMLTDWPAQGFASLARAQFNPRQEVVGRARTGVAIPLFAVRDSTAIDLLRAAGEDLASLRDQAAPEAHQLPGFTVTVAATQRVVSEATAPNVAGVLEGSDPALRDEHLVFLAHMDHVGVGRPVNGDSIYNGADDNASGTAGVVELAEAFASLTPRPRRSVLFLTVSGEERGLWGSGYFAAHPPVPIESMVAALNMDMIGRNWRDTISVIGKQQSSLGHLADRVAREHPELNVHLVDDLWPSENYYFRSDHIHFARRGVPILFFFNGPHADYHRPSDSPDRIDAEKQSRILRMIFHLGLAVANANERPQWNEESRRRIVR